MVFKKGDTETARKGGLQQGQNRQRGVDRLLEFVSAGGSDKMQELMEKQLYGEGLTEGEKGFIKDFKDFLNYVAPKKSNIDHTSKGEQIFPKPILDGLKKEDAQD
jgi:hypothetical protein